MTDTLNRIYKKRSDGGNQVWYGELDRENGRYRTHSGMVDGTITTSEWTQCQPKNIGRSNATTAVQQAEAELEAMYQKRLAREYHENIADIGQARYIKPMLADKWRDRKHKIPLNSLVFFQPKLDGMRAIASWDGEKVNLTSRDGKIIPGAKHIEAQLHSLFEREPDLILDGELYNHEYKDKFEKLISALKREPKNEDDRERARSVVQYHVYDMPSEVNKNFAVRRAAIDELFSTEPELIDQSYIHIVETHSLILESPDTPALSSLVSSALERGYEGGMLRLNTPYEFKRSKGLLKIKDFQDEEFKIIDIEEGKGNWQGYAKVVHIELSDGRRSKATVKGNQAYCKDLLDRKSDAIGKYGTVTFFRYTNEGVPYLPVFKGVRWDDERNG